MPERGDRQPFGTGEDLPLKDALRTVRFVLHRGRDMARVSRPHRVMPPPFSHLAGAVLREVDHLATQAEGAAASFAHSWTGGSGGLSSEGLERIEQDRRAGMAFSRAAYSGLRVALPLLGAEDALISQNAAKSAHDAARRSGEVDPAALAAALMREMMHARVIRELAMRHDAPLDAATARRLALFALMLWLVCERSEGEAEEALRAAVVLSQALADEITAAGEDPAALSRLLREFSDHV